MTFRDVGVSAPFGFLADDFRVRPIRVEDARLDHEAVMESREYLRLWEQSTWPEDDFTVEANRDDLERLVERHGRGDSFGWTVMNLDESECLGCVYAFRPDGTWLGKADVTPLGPQPWTDCDAVFVFWVRKSRLEQNLDRTLLDAMRAWIERDWPLERAVFLTNEQFTQQVEMFEGAGLQRRFELRLSGDPGAYLAYT
jgi:hypothetical protein